jgi:hypothetical protein
MNKLQFITEALRKAEDRLNDPQNNTSEWRMKQLQKDVEIITEARDRLLYK